MTSRVGLLRERQRVTTILQPANKSDDKLKKITMEHKTKQTKLEGMHVILLHKQDLMVSVVMENKETCDCLRAGELVIHVQVVCNSHTTIMHAHKCFQAPEPAELSSNKQHLQPFPDANHSIASIKYFGVLLTAYACG